MEIYSRNQCYNWLQIPLHWVILISADKVQRKELNPGINLYNLKLITQVLNHHVKETFTLNQNYKQFKEDVLDTSSISSPTILIFYLETLKCEYSNKRTMMVLYHSPYLIQLKEF